MFIKLIILLSVGLTFSSKGFAQQSHDLINNYQNEAFYPGSRVYSYDYTEKKYNCNRRDVWTYLPQPLQTNTPVVVFGHGQALNESHYKDTYLHLAQKGVAVIHPEYSSGFFDRNWKRMARDYINLTQCILNQVSELNADAVVFSGHSKGAYVAGIAGGLAFQESLFPKPASLLIMNAAGLDKSVLANLIPEVEMTVIYSDQDSIVKQSISQDLYDFSPSIKKQYINVKSYPRSSGLKLDADHFWPLTKPALLGGTTQNALHYHGSWKWLVAAAQDAVDGGDGTNLYLYGPFAIDKGLADFKDDLIKNF